MGTNEIVGFGVTILTTLGGFFAWIENRSEKRSAKLMENIEHMMDAKIGEYSNRVQSEKMQALERELDRMREYARDKK
jgi:hypothetical protein